MKVTFIRHGHSESNEKNIFSSDVADEFYLTNTGIGQIKQTADEFRPSAHEKVYIYASPMKRTVHSAEIYIKYANLKEPVLQDTRIKEIDYGKYAGHPAEGDAQEKIDAAYAQIKAGNNDVRVGETGETSREFLARNSSTHSLKVHFNHCFWPKIPPSHSLKVHFNHCFWPNIPSKP